MTQAIEQKTYLTNTPTREVYIEPHRGVLMLTAISKVTEPASWYRVCLTEDEFKQLCTLSSQAKDEADALAKRELDQEWYDHMYPYGKGD